MQERSIDLARAPTGTETTTQACAQAGNRIGCPANQATQVEITALLFIRL